MSGSLNYPTTLFLTGVLTLLSFTACNPPWQIQNTATRSITLDTTVTQALDIQNLIEPYHKQLATEMNTVLGYTAVDLVKSKPEGTMGTFATECMAEKAAALTGLPIAFAMQNYGGLRIYNIPAGPVTKGQIFEMMPFENYLVILPLDAENTREVINRLAEQGGAPVSQTISFEIRDKKPVNIRIKGQPIHPDSTYHVTLPDYVARGGDRMGFLKSINPINTGYKIRDLYMGCLTDAQAQGDTIHPQLPGKIIKYE